MQIVEFRSLNYSVLLHLAVAVIALFGVPSILPDRPEPTPLVMSVEVLPIKDISNVKPSEKPIQKAQQAPALKMPKPAEPPKPTVKEKPAEPKPAEKTPAPEKPAEPLPAEKAPDAKAKPTEPAKPKKESADDFAALLNKLKTETAPPAPKKDAKDTKSAEENTTRSDAPYDPTKPLSISEQDAIRSQFVQCWRMPAGSKAGESLAVRVKVTLAEDGAVKTAMIASDQQGRYAADTFFRAAADSAVRAVHKCSPLKNLPPDKYGTWRDMEINFDPKDLL